MTDPHIKRHIEQFERERYQLEHLECAARTERQARIEAARPAALILQEYMERYVSWHLDNNVEPSRRLSDEIPEGIAERALRFGPYGTNLEYYQPSVERAKAVIWGSRKPWINETTRSDGFGDMYRVCISRSVSGVGYFTADPSRIGMITEFHAYDQEAVKPTGVSMTSPLDIVASNRPAVTVDSLTREIVETASREGLDPTTF